MKRGFLILVIFMCFFSSLAQETVKNIDSLLVVLKEAKEDTSKVLLYQKIAGHYNVTHLDSAKTFAEKGVELAIELTFSDGEWANLNTLANFYERKTDFSKALEVYSEALEIVKQTNSTKGFAVVLNNIAGIHIKKAEYNKGLELMFEALEAEEKLGNRNGIAQAYNNIGAIHDHQKKYDKAIESYKKGQAISVKIGDRKMEATQLSNIAQVYSKVKDFQLAEIYLNESLTIRNEIQDHYGLANIYLGYGVNLLDQNELNRAEDYLKQALTVSKEHDLKLIIQQVYQSLSELEQKRKNHKKANTYLYDYIAVKDSILNDNNAKIIAEVETKYETAKKEKEIIEQRAQLAEKELEVKRKNNLIFGSLGLALILGLLGYLFFTQQRMKNQQLQKEVELKTALARIETQNKLQEQRLRISRDLHDNIGAQLTFIISSLDNLKYGFKDIGEKLSNKLTGISAFTTQTIYELRDTIWAMNKSAISFEDLQGRINNFIDQAKVASEKTSFSFSIASEVDTEHQFTSVEGMNIYRIIQEAVNNAIKYAEASKVDVLISEEKDIQFEIKDNGTGFDLSTADLGNGINNMKKRARDVGGQLEVISDQGEGTSIRFGIKK